MQLRRDESTRLQLRALLLAASATVLLGALIWVYEREMLWMLAVLLPPIWIPTLSPNLSTDQLSERSRTAMWLVAAGLTVLAVLAVLVYLI